MQRNIANTFSSKDGSALAALAYAVNHLGVTDIIVCGHQSCGGVQAALASAKEVSERINVRNPLNTDLGLFPSVSSAKPRQTSLTKAQKPFKTGYRPSAH